MSCFILPGLMPAFAHVRFPPTAFVLPGCYSNYFMGGQSIIKGGQAVSVRTQRCERMENFLSLTQVCLQGRQGGIVQGHCRAEDGVHVCSGKGLELSEDKQYGSHEGVVQNSKSRPALSSSEEKRIFIFGFGYTAFALASYLKKRNWNVSGTCRTTERKLSLEQCGFTPFLFNSENDEEEMRNDGFGELAQASHWLTSVPPVADFDRDPVLATHLQDLRIAAGLGKVLWIGYLSSTGVYGDWGGDWVDEEKEPRPAEQRAVARLAAEKAWLQFGLDHNIPVHVFRLGGIYGPGRSALCTLLQKGTLSRSQQLRRHRRFTSRIHVADICQTVLASMLSPCPGRIYNVVDDDPSPRKEVEEYAQGLLHKRLKSVQHLTRNESSPAMVLQNSSSVARLGEKRVSNKRIKEELQIQLLYPTFRSGLLAIFEDLMSKSPQV